jgi:ABC-type transport system involved in multi-copper enzyme maturation permease subunit
MKFIIYIITILILSILTIGVPFRDDITQVLNLYSPVNYLLCMVFIISLIGLMIKLTLKNN